MSLSDGQLKHRDQFHRDSAEVRRSVLGAHVASRKIASNRARKRRLHSARPMEADASWGLMPWEYG
jgi:hypothetical protein